MSGTESMLLCFPSYEAGETPISARRWVSWNCDCALYGMANLTRPGARPAPLSPALEANLSRADLTIISFVTSLVAWLWVSGQSPTATQTEHLARALPAASPSLRAD